MALKNDHAAKSLLLGSRPLSGSMPMFPAPPYPLDLIKGFADLDDVVRSAGPKSEAERGSFLRRKYALDVIAVNQHQLLFFPNFLPQSHQHRQHPSVLVNQEIRWPTTGLRPLKRRLARRRLFLQRPRCRG